MLKILHISDLHFGPPHLPSVAEAVLRCAARLQADVIVASGDFTQRAKPEQFQAARAFLDRLPRVPVVVTPGNHDIPLFRVKERLLTPYDLYRKYIAEELDSVLALDDAVIVAINTTNPLRAITGGGVASWQLDYCAKAFQAAPAGAARILVAHHHFAPAPDYDFDHSTMRGGRQALDRFTQLNVDLILGGHLHRAYIGNSLDVYPGENRASGIVIVQSGTTTSRRGRAREHEKNSFNWIEVDRRRVSITHYIYFHDLDDFAPVGRYVFPRREVRFLSDPPGGE
jgi:3',5'-cyclic AMP phosphodiesterase CpdA